MLLKQSLFLLLVSVLSATLENGRVEGFSLMKLFGMDNTPAEGVSEATTTASSSPLQPQDQESVFFTQDALERNRDLLGAIRAHSFLQELGDSTLDQRAFRYMIIQNAYFTDMFAKVFAMASAKSNDPQQAQFFAECSVADSPYAAAVANYSWANITSETFEVEPQTPVTHHYSAFLMATAARHPVPVILAALMPHIRVQTELSAGLQTLPEYDENMFKPWIVYMSESYPTVRAMELLDQLAADVSPSTRVRMHELFRHSTKLEWMFWDAAYRLESWPV